MDDRDQEPTGQVPNEPPSESAGPQGAGSQGARPRPLWRSRDDRMIAGVCGGLGRYFGIDAIIVRIAAIALVLAGGAGVLIYLAAAILVPEEPVGTAADAVRTPSVDRRRGLTALAVVVAAVVLAPLLLPPVFVVGAVLVPLAAALLAGLGVWWLVSGQGAGASATETLGRSALGLGILVGCALIAVAGAWAAGAGGGVLAAGLVIGTGVVLVVAGFVGGARKVILPALALAVPVAFVSAAGIDLRGGVGDRHYRPASAAELRDGYKLGAGRLVVDLRQAQLPAGSTPLSLDVGMGQALVLVPRDVCVVSRSRVGLGAVQVFDRMDGGADVVQSDSPGAAPGTPRLVVDAHVGMGAFEVGHYELGRHRFGPPWRDRFGDRGDRRGFGDLDNEPNTGCAGREAGAPVG